MLEFKTTRELTIILPNSRVAVVILPIKMNEDEFKYFIKCLEIQKPGICNEEFGLAIKEGEE